MSLSIEVWLGFLVAGYLLAFILVGVLAKKWGLAGTAKAYWLFVPLLLLFFGLFLVILNQGGVIQNGEIADSVKSGTPNAEEFFSQLPVAKLVLMALAGAVWIVGWNIVVYRQLRKAGDSGWTLFTPFQTASYSLDAKAWKTLSVILLVGLVFVGAALSLP